MSVASKNLFALLDDDAPEPQHDSKPSNIVSDTYPSTQDVNKSQPQRGRGPAARAGRYYQRGGKPNAATSNDATDEANLTNKKSDSSSPRGRGRGRGGRGSNRGAPRGRGREFDKHSGTLPDSDKRVHQGWGGDDGQRELQSEQQAVADASAEAGSPGLNDWGTADPAGTTTATQDDSGWDAPATATNDSGWDAPPSTEPAAADTNATAGDSKDGGEFRRRRNAEDEEDDNTLTLDQYLAKQKDTAAGLVPKLEGIRKANEGSDDALWKNAIQMDKNGSDDAYFVGKSKAAPKTRTKKAEKEIIEIDARFERPSRGGGRGRGRGGDDRRGSRGGGRGRGGDRAPRGRQSEGGSVVDMGDQSAFPSLA